jgi:hypothetical protein
MSRATGLSIALVLAVLQGTFVSAAQPPAGDPQPVAEAARPAHRSGTASDTQRRREMGDLRRQDAAATLARLGYPVAWQEHSLRELTEWRARAEAAEVLRAEFGVQVDWTRLSLERLLDLRLRAAKGRELQSSYGLKIDWEHYSWLELEAVRRTMRGMTPASPKGAAPIAAASSPGKPVPNALMPPTFASHPDHPGTVVERDPDGVIRPTFAGRPISAGSSRDPDAVLRPRFLAKAGASDERDPDAVIRPRFSGHPVAHHPGDSPDDLMAPAFAGSRSTF